MAVNPAPAGAPGQPGLKLGSWQPGAAKSAVIIMIGILAVLETDAISKFNIIWRLAMTGNAGEINATARPSDTTQPGGSQ